MAIVPLARIEVVARVEDLASLEERVCLCSRYGEHIGLSIRTVEPVESKPEPVAAD